MGNSESSLPEKSTYHNLREHYADDFPAWTQDGFEIVKLHVKDLLTQDEEALKQIGGRIVEGLSKDSILIIQNSPESYAKIECAAKEAKEFLSWPEDIKKQVANPETLSNKRAFYSGYSVLHFLNNSNRRDPEWRDVYQIRIKEDGHIPWPVDSFKAASVELYKMQWEICVQVLRAIALSLCVDPLDFFNLASCSEDGALMPDPHKSANTNLCYFRYFDKHQSYKTPQKCMVHQDHGLLTLMPKSTLPGLELLHPQLLQWIPMEQFIDNTEMFLYCGKALSMVTNSLLKPATHRVVRQPKLERFSMPFEVKPNDDAVLRNFVKPDSAATPITFDDLSRRLAWERIEQQVNRADGIEPGSEEEKEFFRQKNESKLHLQEQETLAFRPDVKVC